TRGLVRDLPLQHGQQLGARPACTWKPVARADARVAGLIAAAALQLRRDPAGRRQPLRVRRAGCAPRRPGGRARRRAPGDTTLTRILVVANETVGGETLIEALRRRAGAGDVDITVLCPVNPPRQG